MSIVTEMLLRRADQDRQARRDEARARADETIAKVRLGYARHRAPLKTLGFNGRKPSPLPELAPPPTRGSGDGASVLDFNPGETIEARLRREED